MKQLNITKQFIALIGVLLIVCGTLLMAYYFVVLYPETAARQLLKQARISYELESKESLNRTLDLLAQIVTRYEKTDTAVQAYYYMGLTYEKLGLNNLAYDKYSMVYKNFPAIEPKYKRDIQVRLSRLKILRQQTEEGVDQLLALINGSTDGKFRSRLYSELGYAHMKMKMLDKAERMFDLALAEQGNNQEAILGKAKVYKKLGYDNKAYDLYEYYLKFFSHFSTRAQAVRAGFLKQVYFSGYRSYRYGRHSDCIAYFSRLLRNFPDEKESEDACYWIGESQMALHNYMAAIRAFDRALANGYSHKDQSALIKKGYARFMAKQFELATRDFQVYIERYPTGRFIENARKWKAMCTKEILYRIELKDSDEDSMNFKDEPDEKSPRGELPGINEGDSAEF